MLNFSQVLEITLYSNRESSQYFGKDWLHINEEFCRELAAYLLSCLSNGYQRFLEVGAGTGSLSRALNERDIPVIATDRNPKNSNIEKLPYTQALTKYKPDLIVCSWMPLLADWSTSFRETRSVREYILIGNPYLCGLPETYQKPNGWVKRTLRKVQRYAISSYDTPERRETRVISFRRD